MKKPIIITIIAIIVALLVAVAIRLYVLTDVDKTVFKSTETYTKEEYLQAVKANGGGEVEVCSYSYLIDTYGIREVMRLDLETTQSNSDEVDPKFYEAIRECL